MTSVKAAICTNFACLPHPNTKQVNSFLLHNLMAASLSGNNVPPNNPQTSLWTFFMATGLKTVHRFVHYPNVNVKDIKSK